MPPEGTYYCPICQTVVEEALRPIHEVAEGWLISYIKELYPEWTESDGACPSCVQYFRSRL